MNLLLSTKVGWLIFDWNIYKNFIGEIITNKEHLEREAKRDYDNSYVMSFRNRDDGDKLYWVDADDEALWGGTMGRLINHSRRAPNSEKKVSFTIICKTFIILKFGPK